MIVAILAAAVLIFGGLYALARSVDESGDLVARAIRESNSDYYRHKAEHVTRIEYRAMNSHSPAAQHGSSGRASS